MTNDQPIRNKRDNWEAAREKIQYYMHENLKQVRWIFRLTLIAMFLGFVIIICGAVLVYLNKDVTPAIVVTLSGVLVEFIAATFLFVYRSTMEQARGYVNILERIYAVGMADMLVDSIETSNKLRDQTRATIASEILSAKGLDQKDK